MIKAASIVLISLVGMLLMVGLTGCEEERGGSTSTIFNKKMRKLLLKLFRRKLKIPEESSLSLAAQVSRPDIWPGIFNQPDGFVVDAVIELPMWLDLDNFAEAVYSNHSSGIPKAGSFIGTERCFLYEKLEWLLGVVAQISGNVAHSCVLKFICETQAIHTFHPDYPISVAFELIHLILSPSLGSGDPCFHDYVVAENKGKLYGRCDKYDSICYFSVGGILISNFFPVTESRTTPPPTHRALWNNNNAYGDSSGRLNQFFSQFKNIL